MGCRTRIDTSTDTTYRDALIKEEYIMSSMGNCLFYKITE